MTAVERLPTRSAAPAGGQPEVSVVVVTYRSASYVGRCLSALNVALRGVPAEVVVVDNASGDGIREAVAAVAPHALVVVRKQNGGFAAGCHAGAAVARGRRLVFVNPDAMVEPGCVAALLDCADRNPDAGIVGGRCVDEDGRTDPRSWFGRPTLWSVLCFATGLSTAFPGHRLFDPESPRLLSGERKVPVVSGALMLVERATWDDLGGFDPTYFLYGEDADLCLRAAARGWRPVVTPEAVFIHPGGASSSSELKQVFLFTGKATLVRRHLNPGTRALGMRLLLCGVLLRALLGRHGIAVTTERQGRPTTESTVWVRLWRRRGEWTCGWHSGDVGGG